MVGFISLRKMISALVLALVGIMLFVTVASAKVEGPVTVSRTAGRNESRSFNFTINNRQTVYCISGNFYGSHGYARLKRGNTIIFKYQSSYGSGFDLKKIITLDPGEYTVEFNAGWGPSANVDYKVTVSVTYMKSGQLARVVDTGNSRYGKYSFTPIHTTIAYYDWSGGNSSYSSHGGVLGSMKILENNKVIKQEGAAPKTGSFPVEAGKTYTIECEGGQHNYPGGPTYFSARVDITYNDLYYKLTPLIENPDFGELRIDGDLFRPDEPDQFEFQSGDSVQLKAAPHEGCAFSGWEENGKIVATSPTLNVEMNNHRTIKAVFADKYVNNVTAPSAPVIHNQREIRLDWNDVDDLSGIRQYRVKLTTVDQAPGSAEGYLPATDSFLVLPDLSSKNTYYVWVKAEDKAGNISKNWLKIGPFSPPAEKSAVLAHSARAEVIEDTPAYHIQLTLKEADAARYIIERRPAGNNLWEDIAVIDHDGITPDELREFTYTDQTNLTKHARYQYRVYTQNALEEGDETSAVPYEAVVTVPNITAYRIIAPQDGAVTNQTKHTFDIEPKTDVEGDQIRFRVICKNGENTISSSDGTAQNAVDVTFPSDGTWEWTLEIEEYSDGVLIPDSKNEVSGTILIDQTAPHGNFSFKSLDGTELTNYTNSLNLKLSNLQASDNSGTKNSGVAGIYLWNGAEAPAEYQEIDLDKLPEALDETVLASIAAGEEGIYIKVPSGSDPPVYNTTLDEIPWRITGGPDGERIVSLAVKDIAGNIQAAVQNKITLDTTPPEAVTFAPCTFDGVNLVFNWRITDTGYDLKTFYVTKPDGEEIEVTKVRDETNNNQYKGSFGVEMTPYGYNAPVRMEVLAMDQAGNKSESAALTAYTTAQSGWIVPESLTPGYNKETGHQFTLAVTGGIADRQLLEVATAQNFETVVKSVEIGADDKFASSTIKIMKSGNTG